MQHEIDHSARQSERVPAESSMVLLVGQLMSTAEVAGRLGVTRSTVTRLVKEGQLNFVGRFGGGSDPAYVFDNDDLLQYIEFKKIRAEVNALSKRELREEVYETRIGIHKRKPSTLFD